MGCGPSKLFWWLPLLLAAIFQGRWSEICIVPCKERVRCVLQPPKLFIPPKHLSSFPFSPLKERVTKSMHPLLWQWNPTPGLGGNMEGMHVNTLSNVHNNHRLQIYMNKIWKKHSCIAGTLIGWIQSRAEHTNLFVTLGSHTGSPGDVPNGNPQKRYIWMNYSGRGFQWSIHSSSYLCNFLHHHNQEKRNCHLHIPSRFHHKLQKQNAIFQKIAIILVWR